jgi:hypothetical protein
MDSMKMKFEERFSQLSQEKLMKVQSRITMVKEKIMGNKHLNEKRKQKLLDQVKMIEDIITKKLSGTSEVMM